MMQIKRFEIDIRNADNIPENMVNEKLMDLQVNTEGKRNGIKIKDYREVFNSTGMIVVNILYEDKGLDSPA